MAEKTFQEFNNTFAPPFVPKNLSGMKEMDQIHGINKGNVKTF